MNVLLGLLKILVGLAFIGVGLYIMLLGGICVGYMPGAGIMVLLLGGVVVGVGVLVLRSMLR